MNDMPLSQHPAQSCPAVWIGGIFALFLTVAFWLYFSGMHAPMVYDSNGFIKAQEHIFSRDGLLGSIRVLPERPLLMASFYLNYVFDGMNPFWYRVFNVVILALSGVATSLVVYCAFQTQRPASTDRSERIIATVAGLFFVVNPVHIYATLYIWQRGAILACLFYLATLAAYLALRLGRVPKVAGHGLVAALLLLGMLSKENLITVPVILVLCEVTLFRQQGKELLYRVAAVALISLPAVALYFLSVHVLHGEESTVTRGALARFQGDLAFSGLSLTELILTAVRTPFYYLGMTLAPGIFPVQLVRSIEISRGILDPPTTLLSCVALLGIGAGVVVLARTAPLISFGLLFYFISGAPESVLSPTYLFFGYRAILPFAGLLLVVSDLGHRLTTLRRERRNFLAHGVFAIAVCALLLNSGAFTARKAPEWSRMRLWADAYTSLPTFGDNVEILPYIQILQSYAGELARKGDCQRALAVISQWKSPMPTIARASSNSPGLPRCTEEQVLEAGRSVRSAGAIPPDSRALLLSALGITAREAGFTEAAVEQFRWASDLDPSNHKVANNLGLGLMELGHYEEAEVAFKTAMKLEPSYVSPYTNLGNLLMSRGKAEEAIAMHRRAIELQPSSAKAWNNLGAALMTAGSYSEAVSSFTEALRVDPELDSALANLGICLAQLGRPEEAKSKLHSMLARAGDAPRARMWLGKAFQQDGQMSLALEQYRHVLSQRPNMTEARYRLASVLATMSQLNEAVQHLRVVLASNPQHLKALNDLAALYILQRKPDQAVTLLRKAQQLAPDSAQVQQNLAVALQAQSDLAREAESAPVDSQ